MLPWEPRGTSRYVLRMNVAQLTPDARLTRLMFHPSCDTKILVQIAIL